MKIDFVKNVFSYVLEFVKNVFSFFIRGQKTVDGEPDIRRVSNRVEYDSDFPDPLTGGRFSLDGANLVLEVPDDYVSPTFQITNRELRCIEL